MNETNGLHPPPAPFDAWAIMEFWRRRWRWMALWTLAMALAGAWVARLVWSRSFTATAQLIHYEPSSVDDTYHPRDLAAPSLVVMLQAPGLFEDVGSHLQPPVSALVLAERLQITLDRNNDVVTVTASGHSRDEAVDIVNRFCVAAMASTQEMQRQEAAEAGDNVVRQLAQVEGEIASAHKTVPPGSEAAVAALAQGPDNGALAASDLPQRIQLAREQLEDLLARYTDAHPLVLEQRARLAALEEEQRQAPPPAPGGGTASPRPASAPAVTLSTYGRVTPEEFGMGERLRALETNRAMLIARERAIQPFRDDPPGYFRVLRSASANPTQLRRHRLEIVLFAFLGATLGLFGSGAQVLLAEFLDNRIRTRADVRRVTGLPLLATLGDLGRMSPASRDQWAFRTWTALQSRLSISPNHGMVCGITSANCGDGRSTWISLLARAAKSCGFRVLTVISEPSGERVAELARGNGVPPDAAREPGSTPANDLSRPGQVVDQLTSSECPPVVTLPLPGWIWNLERRKQWRLALEAWRMVDHVVIFVELPPAFVAESVLLAENIPDILWLVDCNRSDSEETLVDLATLRDASCNIVGAVFNREPAAPMRGHFSRWIGSGALALLLALGLQAPRASATVEAPAAPDAPAAFSVVGPGQRAAWERRLTLGPGDVLSFHLYGSPELTRDDVPVGPDGTVSYLEAENVVAAGLTVDELRDRLNAELGRFRRSPQAYVTPVSYRSKRYYMLGTVVQKGVFPLDRPITIIEAVARARGFETGISRGDTVDATDFSRSFLARGGQRLPVDFARLFMHGDLSQNIALEPDDYLYFSTVSSGQIYVLGEVGSPGPVPFDSGVSALSAIVSRGGFTARAWETRVLVVRGSLDHPVAFKVDISGALIGKSPNLALEPGDLVYVANRPWIKAEELLDLAATAFAESAVVEWTGINVGPRIFSRPNQQP
jgi:protein involved in polysaccharide export with SLBB domain/capsular polysaccharide biosynthesis protein